LYPHWDDPKILALNPALALPHRAIRPIHRSDESGDTVIFKQYLSLSIQVAAVQNRMVSADEGNDAGLLASVHFAPLPERVRAIARRQIAAIAGP